MKTQAWIYAAVAAAVMMVGSWEGKRAVADPGEPEKIVMKPENVFVPPGFDDNDNAQIVLAGNLPSTCYKSTTASFQLDRERREIRVRNQVYYYPGCWCLNVLVPYHRVIDLGVLEAGTWRIVAETGTGGSRDAGELTIGHSANRGPDDAVYALVDEASVFGAAGSKILVIQGRLSSNCMALDDTEVLYRADDVIEVLPKVRIESEENCDKVGEAFTTQVELQPPTPGRKLVHIRSLNGQSVNKVIDF
jgi:hypothetical protein